MTRDLVAEVKRERLAHRRAIAAPMTRVPMAADPYMPRVDGGRAMSPLERNAWELAGARAHLERRACQYAANMAERSGMLRLPVRDYNATFDGRATVHLVAQKHTFAFTIPAHVLAFDPSAPALALPAPAAEEKPDRCDHTAPLDLAPPVATAALAAPNGPAKVKAARRAPQARRGAIPEFEASRRARAERIAKLPLSTRRAMGVPT